MTKRGARLEQGVDTAGSANGPLVPLLRGVYMRRAQ